jgi:ATP-binding cassette subfamily B protein
MIQFEHVSFGYPEHGGAVEDVSFTLKKGGVTAIIGSNGAGTSTISRLMRGLLKPVSGRVLLDGQDIAGMKISTDHLPFRSASVTSMNSPLL